MGFAEAFVINAAKKAGVRPRWIRPGLERIKREFGIEHALAHRLIYTDGVELLFDDPAAPVDDQDLTVARTAQRQFRKAVKNELELITYAGDGFAESLQLPQYGPPVVVDPRVASGAPMLLHGGARVEDLLDRYAAGEREKQLSRDFGVPLGEVKEIVGSA